MTTNELANTLRAFANHRKDLQGLAPALRADLASALGQLAECSKDLTAISSFLDQFPDQPVPDTMNQVIALLGKDRTSIPRLTQRIQAHRQGQGEDGAGLRQDLAKLSTADAKALVKALGGKADSKPAALEMLEQFMSGQSFPDPNAQKIEAAFDAFQAIYVQVSDLSIADIRSRFEPIRKEAKPILEGVATKLGRQFRGTKGQIADQLLGILEGMKGSQVQTELIGAGKD